MSGNMEQQMKMMSENMLQTLGPADSNYDDRFMDMMISHHECAIAIARDAGEKAQHREIKQMSKKIIQEQEKDIAQLKQWRRQWYDH